MADSGGGNQGTGTPSDALTALANAVVDDAKHPPAEPAPDPKVAAAFALGWQMAELYRPDPKTRTAVANDDLPGLGRLDSVDRATISLNQIVAALAKLGPAIEAASLAVPNTKALLSAYDATPPNYEVRSQAVREFYVELLSTLTAADFRLGKSCGLGRALADTCRNQTSIDALKGEFKPYRIAELCSWLDDLASVFPAHAAKSVHESLLRWSTTLNNPNADLAAGGAAASAANDMMRCIDRQGQLWRGLLSGEKSGADMLVVENYLSAASGMLRTAKRVVWSFIGRFWLLVIVILLLFGGGIALILLSSSSASIIAGATGVLASAGLTWKGVGGALGGIAGPIELNLWGAELNHAIADAITLLPDNKKERGNRRQLAEDAAQGLTPARVPNPELLDPVLDPAQLQSKIARLKTGHAKHKDEFAPEQRLPDDYFDTIDGQIEAEKNEQNPPRVIRAGEASKSVAAPAPPRVVYLSRRPAVSQFMSVITECIESELTGAVTDVSHLDHLWQDVAHWSEELRSRFRRFGPCDVRWIEPKLAQLVSDLEGKHPFCVEPPEVRLSNNAAVFVLGDWATALPQARNVAARLREHLARVEPGTDCHVIHLGDTYYSGLEDECRRRFLDLWPVRSISAARSWTLSGNHDMYSGGHGYFNVLLADPRFAGQSGCSYFALANDHWQLLGLDSSYKNPDLPDLEPPQSEWLSQRIATANGRGTILMTHHQPFSAYESVDPTLAQTVRTALGGHHVEGWLWGHEHRCAVYDKDIVATNYNADANYAAIIGHGGVPQLMPDQTPDEVRKAVCWELADYYQVADDHWALGGFAVLTFNDEELEIQYYDEYGNVRREGEPLAYQPPKDVTQTMTHDPRPVRAPDVLRPRSYSESSSSNVSGTEP
jgi:hypothetical protein